MATLLHPDEVPKDLFCPICLSVPLDPVIVTKCAHVFCEKCITESLYHQECDGNETSCPVCRSDCTEDDLLNLEDESPLAHRIWSNIAVKCEHHAEGCDWTGSISDYRAHKNNCKECLHREENEKREKYEERIHSLEKENALLRVKNAALIRATKNLTTKRVDQDRVIVNKEFETLKALVHEIIEFPISNGKGGYAYDRFSVVPLTKLICQNLEDKPNSIDSNNIFECVKNIGKALRRQRSDNPEHLYIDVRMLIGTCLASTWFTETQLVRIRDISVENNWV